jgi:hypothetical protein
MIGENSESNKYSATNSLPLMSPDHAGSNGVEELPAVRHPVNVPTVIVVMIDRDLVRRTAGHFSTSVRAAEHASEGPRPSRLPIDSVPPADAQ